MPSNIWIGWTIMVIGLIVMTLRYSASEDRVKELEQNQHCRCEKTTDSMSNQAFEEEQLSFQKKALEVCEENLEDVVKKQQVTGFPYFRQFVAQLVNHFGTPWGPEDEIFYQMSIAVSRDGLKLLSNFSRDQRVRVQEAHDVLSQMVREVKQVNPKNNPSFRLGWREEAARWAWIALQISASLYSVIFVVRLGWTLTIPWCHLLSRIIILCMVFSCPWTWCHLYWEEVAKRHALVVRNYADDVCSETHASWWERYRRYSC